MSETAKALVNGVSIAYRDRGNGKAVVFLHGHPFDQTMWDDQVDALSWKYRVITLDYRGYGESEVPDVEEIRLETIATDVKSLLDHLRVERAVLVGLSMGGQVAMAFAELFPERLSGLVLAATFAENETPDGVVARRAMADRFANEGCLVPGGEMIPKLLAAASIKRDPQIAVKIYTMMAGISPLGAAAAMRGRAVRKDYLESLRRVTVPSLIVVGSEDQYVSLERAQRMKDAIPHARLEVFKGMGHMPNLEDTDRFNAMMHAFLGEIG
jgi:3-oxoadipate enol-lactonase